MGSEAGDGRLETDILRTGSPEGPGMTDRSVSRRGFMRTAAGATAATAATGTAAAQEEGGGTPDWGGWFSDVGNYDGSTVDMTGESEVTVTVGAQGNGGGFAFDPPAVHVDTGTTVKFEWTGEGGGHNVVEQGGSTLDSGAAVAEAGVNYEHTFESGGMFKYYCSPHQGLGMKGGIVVGSDFPTTGGGGGGGGDSGAAPEVPGTAKSLGVATTFVMIATLGMAYFFMRYGGDYETPD